MLRIRRPATLFGELRPPSDKSLTHRAYMLGAIANGPSRVRHPLQSGDTESTLRCLAEMGLRFDRLSEDEIELMPPINWNQPRHDLDCGNSGTTMRLLAGLIASRPLDCTLVGDASLSRRPMGRIAEPLRTMGALIEGERPPLRIVGSGALQGIDYFSPVASAQIKTAVLFAGLRAQGDTFVTEPAKSRDHTERMLRAMGVDVYEDGLRVGVSGGAELDAFQFTVPADISSAAFWMVAGAIVPEARVRLNDVNVNPTRTGIIEVFQQARLPLVLDNVREETGEPVADLEIQGLDLGLPFFIDGDLVPKLIDELPVLAVLATQLDGVSSIRNAEELRVKESNRIEAVASGLRAMGATVEVFDDGMDIEGPVNLRGAAIQADHDHRIAMAFAIAGLIADGETLIHGAETIATSYPDFEAHLHQLCVW
jgi:3-phosphoshikimate 1-carboxyvinyltransferase